MPNISEPSLLRKKTACSLMDTGGGWYSRSQSFFSAQYFRNPFSALLTFRRMILFLSLVRIPSRAAPGPTGGRVLFSLGLLGGSLVGAIVVSLTAVWSLGELTGAPTSLCSKKLVFHDFQKYLK